MSYFEGVAVAEAFVYVWIGNERFYVRRDNSRESLFDFQSEAASLTPFYSFFQ